MPLVRRALSIPLAVCLALGPLPAGATLGPTPVVSQLTASEIDIHAFANVSTWWQSRTLDSDGRRAIRRDGSSLATQSEEQGITRRSFLEVLSAAAFVPFLRQRPAQPGTPRSPAVLRSINSIPKPLPQAGTLLIRADVAERSAINFRDYPGLRQAYTNLIESRARTAVNSPPPGSIPNDAANLQRYGPLLVALATEYRMRYKESGGEIYFSRARDMLQKVAQGFNRSDAVNTSNDGLEFAIGMVHYAAAAALLHKAPAGSNIQEEEFRGLIQTFFTPAAEIIKDLINRTNANASIERRRELSNHTTALNAALIALAYLRGGDAAHDDVDFALNNPRGGVLDQIKNSIVKGGGTIEMSSSYTRYVFEFFLLLTGVLTNNGLPLSTYVPPGGTTSIASMANFIIRGATPNYSSPVFGDSSVGLDYKNEAGQMAAIVDNLMPNMGFGHLARTANPTSRESTWTTLMVAIAAAQAHVDSGSSAPAPLKLDEMFEDSGITTIRSDDTPAFFDRPAGKVYLNFMAGPYRFSHGNGGAQNAINVGQGGASTRIPIIEGGNYNIDTRGADEILLQILTRYIRGLAYNNVVVGDGTLVDQDPKGSRPGIIPESNGHITFKERSMIEGRVTDSYFTPVIYDRQSRLEVNGQRIVDVVNVQAVDGQPKRVTLAIHPLQGAQLVDSSLQFQPGQALPGEIYLPVGSWRTANIETNQVVTVWRRPDGSGVTVILTSNSGPMRVDVAEGPPNLNGVNQPIIFGTVTSQPGSFTTVLIPISEGQTVGAADLKTSALASTLARASGVRVELSKEEHWHATIIGKPGQTTLSAADGSELVVHGKYADVAKSLERHEIVASGQVASFRIRAPAGEIKQVTVNGERVPFQELDGFVVVKKTHWTRGPLDYLKDLAQAPFAAFSAAAAYTSRLIAPIVPFLAITATSRPATHRRIREAA